MALQFALQFVVALLMFFGSVQAVPAQERSAPPSMTNGDVVKLVKGGLNKDLIIQTIKSGPNHFDLSANALLDLKDSGVPDDVIRVMVSPKTEPTSSSGNPQPQDNDDNYLWLHDGAKKFRLELAHNETITNIGYLQSIGVAPTYGYVALPENSPTAALRITSKSPSIGEFANLLDRRIAELVYLIKFEIDPDSKRRRIQIFAKTSMFSRSEEGIPQKARIPIVFTEIREATIKGKSMRVYSLAPATSLEPGEYAIVLESGGRFYDFGIDP